VVNAGMCGQTTVEIQSGGYWFKVVEMLQQNWALVDRDTNLDTCTVFFVQDASGVFDRMRFPSIVEAEAALRRNGFARFSKDTEAQKFLAAPRPPFFEAHHPNGAIYSSGRFWR
jgi:hypothetical protein